MVNSSANRRAVLRPLTAWSSARKSYSRRHGDYRWKDMVYDSLGIVHVHALEVLAYKMLRNHLNSNMHVRCLSFRSPCICAFKNITQSFVQIHGFEVSNYIPCIYPTFMQISFEWYIGSLVLNQILAPLTRDVRSCCYCVVIRGEFVTTNCMGRTVHVVVTAGDLCWYAHAWKPQPLTLKLGCHNKWQTPWMSFSGSGQLP